ncbi:hypothetical protein J9100_004264 [Vibrio vulnificus]|nr:hypothetical protein [Vibrio vulnificus]
MANQTLRERLKEPLTETTRKVRRNLLASAFVGIVIIKVGLVPKKISAFGIEFSEANQESLLALIAGITCFYIVTFLVYIASELTAWNIALRAEEIDDMTQYEDRVAKYEGDMQMAESSARKVSHLSIIAKPVFLVRLFIEVGLPVGISLWSMKIVLGY